MRVSRFGRHARRTTVGMAGLAIIAGIVVTGAMMAVGAGATNGQEVTFGKVHCSTNVGISQDLDVTVQAVVPNNAALNESYGALIPGGTATLPSNSGPPANIAITAYKNLKQTYLFSPSSGSVQITSAVASSPTADNNGTAVPFQVSFT